MPTQQELDLLAEDWKAYDALFAAWLEKNPDGDFSKFTHLRVRNGLAKGAVHQTLGPNLKDGEWWQQGIPAFQTICSLIDIAKTAKVCEFGCGSARVGVHFINRQAAGCYFGVDILSDFYKYGIEIMGSLVQTKKPKFDVLPEGLEQAIAWGADLVYTTAVSLHVHPDYEAAHYATLRSLAAKPGAIVIVQAYVTDTVTRIARSGWARPTAHYQAMMAPFQMIAAVDDGSWNSLGIDVGVQMLVFSHP